jgi:hypothetical protein
MVMFGFAWWKAAITASKAAFSVSPDQFTKLKVWASVAPDGGVSPPF